MRTLTIDEFKLHKGNVAKYVEDGAIFIYPTDTIYGIGCNAVDEHAVGVLRSIKYRYKRPFSVIAPNKDWIRNNCDVTEEGEEWLEKLPGPYTLILKLKDKTCVAPGVCQGVDTLGVRIPDHWISELVSNIGVPVVTTSVNLTGEDFANSVESISPKIKGKVDFAIDEGEKTGRPSTLVHLDKGGRLEER
ncbi:L-threonylcarbamoyladenylate synthase [Nanoarchaeota archaeon]